MPKSKTRKGKGNSNANHKGFERGIEETLMVALNDLLPDGPEKNEDGDICPACSLEKRGYTGLAILAREIFHWEAAKPHKLRAI